MKHLRTDARWWATVFCAQAGGLPGRHPTELRTKLQPEHQTLCFKVPLALEWHALGYTSTELTLCASDAARGVVIVQHSSYEPGVASIAAPIHDMTDRVVAAINISAVALLTSDAELDGPLKAEVLATADAISRDLGYRQQDEAKNAHPSHRAANSNS